MSEPLREPIVAALVLLMSDSVDAICRSPKADELFPENDLVVDLCGRFKDQNRASSEPDFTVWQLDATDAEVREAYRRIWTDGRGSPG